MKNKYVVRVLAVVALLAAVGVIGYRTLSKPATTTARTRNATVEVADVRPVITATGSLSGAVQTSVNFEVSGKLTDVNVKAGDVVKVGDTLGKLDSYDLGRSLDQAKANLESAKIRREQALANDDVSIEAAQMALSNAQLGVDAMNYSGSDRLTQAQAGLDNALIRQEQALSNDDAEIAAANDAVATARDDTARAQAQAKLKMAQDNKDFDIRMQNNSVAQARQSLADSSNQTNTSYQQAQSKVQQAQDAKNYDKKLQDIQVNLAQQSVDKALRDFNNTSLTAPVAGTVLSVNYSAGDQVSGSGGSGSSSSSLGSSGSSNAGGSDSSSSAKTASSSGSSGSSSMGGSSTGSSSSASKSSTPYVVIGDPGKMQVTLTIDQNDIADVKVGQSVDVTVDAIQDETFKGKITQIDPTPSSSQGVTTYSAYASIDKSDSMLKTGMSATAKIDQGARKGVLVVPNMAVRATSNGKVVRKMVDGTPTDVTVVTGASDDNYTEVKSGLFQGDQIIIDVFQATSSSSSSSRSGFMGMGGMGGMGAMGGGMGGSFGGGGTRSYSRGGF